MLYVNYISTSICISIILHVYIKRKRVGQCLSNAHTNLWENLFKKADSETGGLSCGLRVSIFDKFPSVAYNATQWTFL